MLLKFTKFKTPTMRNRTKNIINIYKYTKILSKFIIHTKKKSGRNNSGKITVRGRQKSLDYITAPTILIQKNFNEYFFKNYIYNSNKKKKYHVIQTYNNIFYAQPAVNLIELGIIEQQNQLFDYQKKMFSLGSVINLFLISYFVKFSNITIFNNRIQYTKSPGTYSLKIKANKKEKMLQIILPSKKYKFLPKNTLIIIGTNENTDKHNLKPGKAGYNRLLGFRPISRGVARNPVDHPNGGRTKSCQPEKSPWGWVAKHNK